MLNKLKEWKEINDRSKNIPTKSYNSSYNIFELKVDTNDYLERVAYLII